MPRGWIGTTSQWRQGLGIAFALLNLVLLAFCLAEPPRWNVTGTTHGWLFASVGLVPVMVPFLSGAFFGCGSPLAIC